MNMDFDIGLHLNGGEPTVSQPVARQPMEMAIYEDQDDQDMACDTRQPSARQPLREIGLDDDQDDNNMESENLYLFEQPSRELEYENRLNEGQEDVINSDFAGDGGVHDQLGSLLGADYEAQTEDYVRARSPEDPVYDSDKENRVPSMKL